MDNNKQRIHKYATMLFDSLDEEGYQGWLCVREQEDDARIRDWSFLSAKSPEDLFRLVFDIVEILYLVEDEEC